MFHFQENSASTCLFVMISTYLKNAKGESENSSAGRRQKLLTVFKHFNMVLPLAVKNWCRAKKAICGKTPVVVRDVTFLK